ncbi:hypothetical protein [Ornithobacterium rhinotracheale]|uniref:hypothetical protein n=1 Tax=Ornithobacterium rhinotracheale TaxID=28251 RepID=UPI0002DB60C4|nr:hypothetical protein [Ornithobacterium rhinotracheale]KGB67773.1 hypothetical protein Q787_00730 [Ornithobacterium rhinotracheale H06-030791]MBN3662103.1 hypothetical protein [Ornithobacterium rhinotracheale]MCK0194684.1 hypothetical protein [Ornithobacterium rhinotracheale]MCK0201052.1 hypothetical protein [Ornithobacterium rhinotracheale]UOH63070.1 hypothetical protein MT993_08630 [Ornithobacterium rhinotracheale]
MFGIKAELQKIEEKERELEEAKKVVLTEENKGLPKDEFSETQFETFWNNYLTKLESKDESLYNIIKMAQWKIENQENISLSFYSETMAVKFENVRDELINELRQSLNNYYVNINKKVIDDVPQEMHIKTRRDVFNDMVKENPLIEVLHQKFLLDIDNMPD